MSTPPTSSRRRTFDFPKSSPDAGLAEWTSRIKAIQQEVDRDEEAEQRRLQDEITHSRMERARRRNTAMGSIDWAKKAMIPSSESSEDIKSIADRQQHQSDALRKLAGSTGPSRSPFNAPANSLSSTVPQGSNPESISLAAFMGGRATGPKLNKHPPQQDSYDSTSFDLSKRDGPHPIFGRANEAVMNGGRSVSFGMPKNSVVETERHEDKGSRVDSTTGEPSSVAASSQESSARIRPSPEVPPKPVIYLKPLHKTVSSPDMTLEARPSAPEVPEKPVMYRKTLSHTTHSPDMTLGPGPSSQVRTPPKVPVKPSLSHNRSQATVSSSLEPPNSRPIPVIVQPKPPSLAEMIGGRATGPRLNKQISLGVGELGDASVPSRHGLGMQGRALPGMGGTQSPSLPKSWSSNISSIPLKSNPSRPSSQQSPSSDENSTSGSFPNRSFSGPQVVTPSLARLVQPQVTVQPSPIAAASTTVSPAFLRAPPSTQDLHPSLSRLQGRGFVEKRVKASDIIYEGPNTQKRERSTSGGASGRRGAVLDIWQPNVVSPASPPPTSPLSVKRTNKDKIIEEIPVTSHLPMVQIIRPRSTPTQLGKAIPPKLGEATQVMTTLRIPGMASPASLPPKQRTQPNGEHAADELTTVENGALQHYAGKVSLTSLSHPTRDRARKPRKGQGSSAPTKSSQPKTPDPECSVDVGRASESEPDGETSPPGQATSRRAQSPEPIRQLWASVEPNVSRLKDELTAPTRPNVVAVSSDLTSNGLSSALATGRQVIPEIVVPSSRPPVVPRPITPPSTASSPEETPSRHSRIPSTGQRATVMDVAQALQEHEQHIRETSLTPEPEDMETGTVLSLGADAEPEAMPRTDVKAAIAGWGRNVGSGVQHTERRRSVYDRYSVIALPPLPEEKTPVPTPEGSLSRAFSLGEESTSNLHDIHQNLQDWALTKDAVEEAITNISAENIENTLVETVWVAPVETVSEALMVTVSEAPMATVPLAATEAISETPVETVAPPTVLDMDAEQEIRLDHHDRPPPGFNIQSLLKETPYSPDPRTQTISVEVLSISGHIATAVTREPNVFYDSEVVAVVHRAKEKTSGLVSTKVWAWRGKDAEFEEREERKVAELAGRFGTRETHCLQGSEPHELIHILGGVLAIRQGKRVHWTAENTAMHRVHRIGDSIFVDQIDLAINNLCSAYSYCLSVLDALYVWHGVGSSEDERKVASAYAQSVATDVVNLTEFEEGAEDEMFWMILGDDGSANASHWKFRPQLDQSGARLYIIDSTRHKAPVQLVPIFSGRDLPGDGVFVVDCRLELFVVVTPAARGQRIDIQLALFLAENISAATANKRPFDPPVHVVILPSKLPLELQAAIRLCDEARLNGGSVPDHMNLLPLSEALEHMQRSSWSTSTLSDISFLPLGVDPRML